MQKRLTKEATIKSRSGVAFIKRISTEALESAAVNHPYLRAMREGDFPDTDMAFKDFAFQYGLYSCKFIRYVSAVTENLSRAGHRRILLSNLAEELGNTHDVDLPTEVIASVVGQSHARLYRRFQDALGVDAEYRETARQCQAGAFWSQQFLKLCETSESVGVGAIGIGTEFIVSSIYHQVLEGIKAHSGLTMTQRVFFDLHSQCDQEHGAQMLRIAEDLAEDGTACEQIEYGTRMAIDLRVAFWDQMLERARNFPTATSLAV